MTRLRPALLAFLALLALSGATSAQPSGASAPAEAEKGVLASLISRALSTPTTRVSIGAVEGALSSDATVRDIEIADRDGVWLRLDRARLVWRRLALLQRRLEIDRLEIGTLEIRRRPVPAEEAVPGEDQPLLPNLPVKVEVKAFELGELRLGEPILGTPARLAASGAARLGNDPAEGLDLSFEAHRLDGAGTLNARLALVPQGEKLTLSVKLDEPAGGLLARAANVPGLPPVKLDVAGEGTLDAFAARLLFQAGDGIGATGTAQLARDGPARRLSLDMEARIAGLLPEAAAPVFAGATRLTGSLTIADGGAITVPGIAVVASAARLDIAGSLSAGRIADLTVTAANLPTEGGRTVAGGAEIRRLAFRGHVAGPLDGPIVEATLSAGDARLPDLRLDRLEATFRASPDGQDAGGAIRLAISGEARAGGLVLTDPARARAVGDRATLAFKGSATTKGVAELETLRVTTPTLSARYAGRLGSEELRGRLGIDVANLKPFGDLVGRPLAGSMAATADVEGTPRAHRFNAALDGRLTGFATGLEVVDGALGEAVALSGKVAIEPTGGYAVDTLTLTGAALTARADGRVDQDSGDLSVSATLSDLARLDRRLTGKAALVARVTGGLQHPSAEGQATVLDATARGRPVPRLALSGDVRDATGALDATVKLDGIVDGRAARGGFHVARPAAGGFALDGLDVAIGSVTLAGSATLDSTDLAAGRLTVKAGNLDDLSALLLAKATGSLEADLTLSARAGGQDARLKGQARNVGIFGVSLSRADADLALSDIYRRPVVSGTVRIDEAGFAGERLSRLRLDAKPPAGAETASAVDLSATLRGFDLQARARIVPGDPTRIEVAQLSATRGRDRIALAGPATLALVEGGVDLRRVAFAFGAGRLDLGGVLGRHLDLRAEARAVPLATADLFAPGLGLAGTLGGTARLSGTLSAPAGEYRLRVDGFQAAQTRGLGLPRIDATAAGALANGRASLDATVTAGRAASLRVSGSVPAGSSGPIDLELHGSGDAGAATTGILAAGGRRLTGRLALDARLAGTFAAPQASGTATLSGGTFSDAAQGVQFSNLRARLVARGQELTVEELSASARNGGTLSGSGRVRLDPAAGFPGEIRLRGRNAELVRNATVTAIANLDLSLSGALARDPRVSGRVDLVSADVRVPENLPGTLKPLPGTRHLHPDRTTQARLALTAQRQGKGGRAAPAFDASLDLSLNAPGEIFVRGRGLNAELGGSLRLTGTLAKPVPNGAFELRRGTFQALTTRLDFTRGRLSFTGDLTPELDFAATTNAGGAAIQVAVTGPADNPSFSFTSNPDLPQDEVLSRLLFNSPSGQLSAFQALALAQAAAQFSSGEGSDAFEGLRRSLGLSGLDIGLGSGGGIGADLQRSLGNRVSVGVKAGATAGQTGIGIDYRITNEIRLQGDVGATGGTSVGIGAQYEW